VAAGSMAVKDSGLDLSKENMESFGIIFSSAIGGTPIFRKYLNSAVKKVPSH
jgi:hypothetical protein